MPYASLLQSSPLQGLISALCLPVARPPAWTLYGRLVCVLYPRPLRQLRTLRAVRTHSSAVVCGLVWSVFYTQPPQIDVGRARPHGAGPRESPARLAGLGAQTACHTPQKPACAVSLVVLKMSSSGSTCVKCGEKIPGRPKFCSECGAKFDYDTGVIIAHSESPPKVSPNQKGLELQDNRAG